MPKRPLLLAFVLAPILFSCGARPFIDARDRAELKDDSGMSARWSPKRPAIGDLVRVEASIPGRTGEALASPLGYPEPEETAPLSKLNLPGSVLLRWSFRVKSPGEYRLGNRVLFEAASLAKDATELKTADANALWTGRTQ